jgi:hypothetical protein
VSIVEHWTLIDSQIAAISQARNAIAALSFSTDNIRNLYRKIAIRYVERSQKSTTPKSPSSRNEQGLFNAPVSNAPHEWARDCGVSSFQQDCETVTTLCHVLARNAQQRMFATPDQKEHIARDERPRLVPFDEKKSSESRLEHYTELADIALGNHRHEAKDHRRS